MGTIVELRPDRRLLNHQFEGYKLSLASLAHWSHELVDTPDTHHPAELQYSFLHAKLFALHQHLRPDPHHIAHSLYYIDVSHRVHALHFDASTRQLDDNVVYDIPENVPRQPGHFNPCLIFPSLEIAILSDGTGFLHIVSTDDRFNPKKQWKTLHSHLLSKKDKYFVLVDCRLQDKNETQLLHCLVESIEQISERFSTVLTWVTFEQTSDSWKIVSTKDLKGKGTVHYAALETGCSAIYIASDHPFKFTSDTDKDIEEQKPEPRKILYSWLQTADDVTVTLKLPNNFNRDDVHINVSSSHIKVSYAGSTFIDGKLQHSIDSELTTWNIQNDGKLDILVTKSDSALWDNLIEGGDTSGEQILDASLVEEAHQRLAHLCSETEVLSEANSVGFSTHEQLEECDATSEEDTTLVRLDAVTHAVTHRIPLSVHQYLFQVHLEPREAPSLALRHDVDACVWQPYAKLANSQVWPVRHQGTLLAFGYIQSSKQNKKFVTCSPNFAYSVVCESSRHVFVYRTNGSESQGCQLSRRSERGAKTVGVGQQYVFNIEKWGEVLGIYASNEYLFILTPSNFVVVEMI